MVIAPSEFDVVFTGEFDVGFDVEFDGEFEGLSGVMCDVELQDDGAALAGARPFCSAWPTNPPTTPAINAIKSPLRARIHHRVCPLRDVA
jgi:hypothetical protein